MPTHKLNVEYNEAHSFWKVTCPEGDYVTTYADTDDITTYYGGKEAYLPKCFSENQIRAVYRCITEKEHLAYEAACKEALEEKHRKERAEFERSKNNIKNFALEREEEGKAKNNQ